VITFGDFAPLTDGKWAFSKVITFVSKVITLITCSVFGLRDSNPEI
jgi:hypothetical protein